MNQHGCSFLFILTRFQVSISDQWPEGRPGVIRTPLQLSHLASPAIDDKMIKMVKMVEKTTMTLSFYFRYPPQKVTTESNKETGMLILDILLGNQLSASLPELSSKLQGLNAVKRGPIRCPQPCQRLAFCQKLAFIFYPIRIPAGIFPPPKLHLPPFPLAAALPPHTAAEQWLPEEILTASQETANGLQVCHAPARTSDQTTGRTA